MTQLKKWVPAIFMMTSIFLLSSMTGTTVHNVGLGKQTFQMNGHFMLYFFLCITLYKGLKEIADSMFWSYMYGVTDEIHQLFVPGRSWEYKDLVINLFGIFLAGIFLWKLKPLLPNKLRNWLEN